MLKDLKLQIYAFALCSIGFCFFVFFDVFFGLQDSWHQVTLLTVQDPDSVSEYKCVYIYIYRYSISRISTLLKHVQWTLRNGARNLWRFWFLQDIVQFLQTPGDLLSLSDQLIGIRLWRQRSFSAGEAPVNLMKVGERWMAMHCLTLSHIVFLILTFSFFWLALFCFDSLCMTWAIAFLSKTARQCSMNPFRSSAALRRLTTAHWWGINVLLAKGAASLSSFSGTGGKSATRATKATSAVECTLQILQYTNSVESLKRIEIVQSVRQESTTSFSVRSLPRKLKERVKIAKRMWNLRVVENISISSIGVLLWRRRWIP